MRLLLLCNYAPDAQQSMLRFGALLHEQWRSRGIEMSVIAPEQSAVARNLMSLTRGAGTKWLSYLDKYVMFRRRLARTLAQLPVDGRTVVHVVDHSNAVYVPQARALASPPWIVTCHDLLAVRGALGEDTDCPASALGEKLQRRIVRGLGEASAIVADSTSTLQDVQRLVPASASQVRRLILLGLSHPYHAVEAGEARARLAGLPSVPWDQPFLVHVGSNLARKNKAGVLRVFARVAAAWPGNLVFCGAPLPPDLQAQAAAAGLASRIFAVPSPDNAQLEAIYSRAHALVFPSKCEGFGWPVIEAHACGCPVVCSDRTSLPEIGGEAALVHALEDEAGMSESLLRLTAAPFRSEVVARGLANLKRFDTDRMIDAYGEIYEEVLAASASR